MSTKRIKDSTCKAYSKRQLMAIIQKEECFEGSRGKPTCFCGFTIHGSRFPWEDDIDTWVSKEMKLHMILEKLIDDKEILAWIECIEFWTDEERFPLRYIRRANHHIHFAVIGSRLMLKNQWHYWFLHTFASVVGPLDHNIDSCFNISNKKSYGIPYLFAYCCKRYKYRQPNYSGITKDQLLDLMEQHRRNPIEYQVDLKESHAEGLETLSNAMIFPKAHTMLVNMFFEHDITWFACEANHFCYMYGNKAWSESDLVDLIANRMPQYLILLNGIIRILRNPIRYLAKFMVIPNDLRIHEHNNK